MRIMILFSLLLLSMPVFAQLYGERICNQSNYTCYKVKSGDSWNNLFPNVRERDLTRRLNRMNIPIRRGMIIAIPKNFNGLDAMDLSPFPHHAPPSGTNIIKVDQSELAWGAYDASGRLLKWGPISGGKNYCADVKRGCRTINGDFQIYRRQGAGCRSSKYPRPNGGAKMPYCMHFYRGYALHGSSTVPGQHASHGCIRLFIEDAKWLNQNFIAVGRTKVKIVR